MFTRSVYKRFENAFGRGRRRFRSQIGRGFFLLFSSPCSANSVHHGARLDYDELQEVAHRLLTESDYTQLQMADRLDVSRISVARAVTEPGPKFQRLQMQIVEALSDFEVERRERVEFRTWETVSGETTKKGGGSAGENQRESE